MNKKLLNAVQNCTPHGLLLLASNTLSNAGYENVCITDRRSRVQRFQHGSFQLKCEVPVGSTIYHFIVKLAPYRVRLTVVDEFASMVSRHNADFGLLLSPYLAAPEVRSQQAYYRAHHVSIIDGPNLGELLEEHQIGVLPNREVDFEFFADLESASQRRLALLAEVSS